MCTRTVWSLAARRDTAPDRDAVAPVAPGADGQDGGRSGTLAPVFLGDNLLAYLLLAMGGALCVGNVAALARPRDEHREGELVRAPVARSVAMAALGGLAALWALVSLTTGS